MDKEITQLSKSHSFFDDDDDDPLEAAPPFDFRSIPQKHTTLDHLTGDRGGAGVSPYCAALISEIDRKIKEHTENVVHAVGGLSARVSQLESRTRQVENAVGDLKDSVVFNHGRIELKIRELGNSLEEVQSGIRDLRDKHEIAEAQLQLAKLTMSKVEQSSSKSKVEQSTSKKVEQSKHIQINSAQELQSSIPQQPQLQAAVPVMCPQQPSSLPSGAAQNLLLHNIPSTQGAATAPQLPTQYAPGAFPSIPSSESNYPPPMLTPDSTYQQYPVPSNQQMQQPFPAPPQPCQPTAQFSPVSQLPNLHQHPPVSMVTSHNLPSGYEPKDISYLPSQSVHKSSLPPTRSPPVNEFFMSSKQQNQGQFSNHPYSELSSGYSHSQGQSSLNNRYPYSASSSGYNGSTTKPSHVSPSSSSIAEAGKSYSRLPTAKILPHAIPTASSVDSGSDSSASGNRIPVDDVIDKVVAMGFRRDLVRATVRKLTANGQSVDLNVVLDKLMNGQDI
ncbi:hypothetical protein CCACVL1_30763 [Corchorus capsularis]|uniref:DUF1421 domain-containing protein n=1 Tax=Corchorus capsularis TaxID=210143 RepID=A0A1R3FVL9_COCAP|nr:hypothetical protein CCACVL1_30763 [Corchorus capsularis]